MITVDTSNQRSARTRLTAARARRASLEELRPLLTTAPARYLEGAIENPELTPDDMAVLLRNRAASPALLIRVAQDRRWTRHYDVKRALVRHPKTPYSAARGLVSHLYWRDLAETIDDARVHPALRRQAELVLIDRLAEMSVGERISLARRATAGLIVKLCVSREGRVLQALLCNPRLKEVHAVSVASDPGAPGELLGWLARHAKWGNQREVRMALLGNPRTPVAEALKVLAKLPRQDVERLAGDDEVPTIIRVGADRRLGSGE